MSTSLMVLIVIFVLANVVSAIAWVVNVTVVLERHERDDVVWKRHINDVLTQEQSWMISNAVPLEDRIELEKLIVENRLLKEQRDQRYLNKKEEDTNDE